MNLSRSLLFSQLCTAASSASFRNVRGGHGHSRHLKKGHTRIIGGDEAPEDLYSYAVALVDEDGDHFCGGSLIARDVVLSAAHCNAGAGEYTAVVGRHSLEDDDGEEIEVAVETMHPDYDEDTDDNDFMLLFLEEPTAENVTLVRVGPEFVPAGVNVTVMGWGDMAADDDVEETPDELMEVTLTTISNEECERSEGWIDDDEPDDYHDDITDNMLCAEDAGEDSCQGDSGGPLVIRPHSGKDVQVGVVSWGIGCALKDFPGVYARISAQYDWIRTNVCDGSSDPPAWFECEGEGGQTLPPTTQPSNPAVQGQTLPPTTQSSNPTVEGRTLPPTTQPSNPAVEAQNLASDQGIAVEAT